ncbi:MAG: hypothetical protein WDW19_03840 [Neisseriaceae bacterium]
MLYLVDRSTVILKPSAAFLTWLNQNLAEDGLGRELTLEQIRVNCRTLLVPQQATPEEIMTYVGERYLPLFELEVGSWFEDRERWPSSMDLADFWEFFDIEILDEVLDLVDATITNHSLEDN